MLVTIEVINKDTLNLLQNLEGMGLIHVHTPISQDTGKNARKEAKYSSFLHLQGIHKNMPGASVEKFLQGCREDKEFELAVEKRQQEEHTRLDSAKLSP